MEGVAQVDAGGVVVPEDGGDVGAQQVAYGLLLRLGGQGREALAECGGGRGGGRGRRVLGVLLGGGGGGGVGLSLFPLSAPTG
ncbi:hypothetical protein, partial [Streptomyces bambusae]|uniref:hypothetical protein n=1 Tax=Streptomyces bambusae TaxID=1550616 RepID=UPI002155B64F